MTEKPLLVTAALLKHNHKILIAQRKNAGRFANKWEFPGGKIDPGETPQQALHRELQEELGIRPQTARPLIQIRHDYPDKQVLLDVWEVSAFAGEPHGVEGQPVAWVSARELADYQFPAANEPIVAAARLSDQYLITPDGLETPELLRGLKKAIAGGIKLRPREVRELQVSARQVGSLQVGIDEG